MTLFITLMAAAILSTTRPATAPSDLTVMTFNIRFGTADDGADSWPKRRELLFRTIAHADPDLLGTQETLAGQMKELRERFPDYMAVGVGRDDGKRNGEFTALFFRKDRFKLVDQGNFWLSEAPDEPGSKSWDSALPRMATWVKLRDRTNGNREFIFINTHYDHRGDQARRQSSRLIRAKLKELAGEQNLPVILTGDLNAHEDSPAVTILLGDDLIDAYRQVHPQKQENEATFHGFNGKTAGGRIDFVVNSKAFRCVEATIDRSSEGGRYPSDHYAVVCRLRRE